MQRVFGALCTTPDSTQGTPELQHDTNTLPSVVMALERQITLLEETLKDCREEKNKLFALLESHLLVQLPAPPGQNPEAPTIQAPKKKKKGGKKRKK
ncbi:MAG: hypothetical protein GY862_01815 [Gammaproteobacteria bacterium]|nr:hypothetical protein [Gammaproteobacteria bacterium]